MNLTRREFGCTIMGLSVLGSAKRARAAEAVGNVWTTGKVEVPGGSVVWRAHGKGAKIPLLLVHGGPSPTGSKRFITMSALGDERRLFTWDQLDCGDSDHPGAAKNWRLARYVEEMDIVRNKLAPGPVHVLGGSWGSTLLMEWLVTKRPSDVASVIFMCPTLDSTRAEASRRNAQMKLSPASKQAFEEAFRTGNFQSPATAAANAEYSKTYIVRHGPPGADGGPPNRAILRAMSADWRKWSRVADLAGLSQPLLFIRGEHDYITDEDIRAYAAARQGAQAVTIPDAGHLAFIDKPEETNAAIRQFLRQVEK